MEKIIDDLEKDLGDIIKGKPPKVIREESGDMVDIRLLRMVVFSLQWASVGYQSALRFAGMRLGRRLGENSERAELSLILEEIKRVIEALKGGKVEFGVIPDLKGAEFKVFESSLAAKVPNVLQNLCFFEEGFIEGYLDGVISKKGSIVVIGGENNFTKVSCKEMRCVGLGDDFCSFLIKFEA